MTVNPSVRRAGELFAHQTGTGTPEMIAAATAWAFHEGGNKVTANNPWNLHGVKGNYGGLAIGDWYAGSGDVHVAKFATLEDGVQAAVMNLRAHGSDFAHYDAVLAAAKTGDGLAFLDALARSAWSAGRYGGPEHNALVPLYRTILPTVTTTPTPPPAPPTEEPPVKPGVFNSEPIASLGGIGPIVAAVIGGLYLGKVIDETTALLLAGVATALVPVVNGVIGRQYVTPNAKVEAKVEQAKVTSHPAAVSDDDLSLPAGYDAELWNAIISRSMASHAGKEPPRHEVLATYQKDVRNGALDPKPTKPTAPVVNVEPPLISLPEPTPAPPAKPVRSAVLYSDWAAAWIAAHFGATEPLRVDPSEAFKVATPDEWRKLCASERMGDPDNPVANGDYSLFTGVTGITTMQDVHTYHAWINGQLVRSITVTGDGFDGGAFYADVGIATAA